MVAIHKYSLAEIMDQTFLIALGSNLNSSFGSPKETLHIAITLLSQCGFKLVAVSSFYKTPAFPPNSGPEFVNAAAIFQGKFSSQEILVHLHKVEADAGRVRTRRWGQRVLDLDLLFHGDRVLPNQAFFEKWHDLSLEEQTRLTPDRLILPHPRLQDRAFVLIPLAEIAPDWVHPVLNKTVTELRDALPDAARREIVVI